MRFFRFFSADAVKPELQEPGSRRGTYVRRMLLGLVITALFAGCGGCYTCKSCKSSQPSGGQPGGQSGGKLPGDISDLSIVFVDGQATLYWEDPADDNIDHVEISWDPGGDTPVRVNRGVRQKIIPGLQEGTKYTFNVKSVNTSNGKSANTSGGSGKIHKVSSPGGVPPGAEFGITGTPVAGQATLSWTNPNENDYDHIEITYRPDFETLVKIPKGAHSKTLINLRNGVEHTFYVTAVAADGKRTPLTDLGLFIPDFATSSETVSGKPVNGQVTLNWKNPPDPDLDHFEIYYSPNGETAVAVARGEHSKTITGLSDETEYEFTVYAANTSGHKRPLMGVEMTSLTAASAEDVKPVIGKPLDGQLTLTWKDPDHANLDHVEIVYTPDGGAPVSVSKGVENKVFTGLSDDKEYAFIVYGVDAVGNRRIITTAEIITSATVAETASELPFLTGRPAAGQVTLNWKDPPDPDIDHIEVSYGPGGGAPVPVAKGVQTHTFTGLSDNADYNFTVAGVSASGEKRAVSTAEIEAVEFPVLIGTPINGQLSLNWKDPGNIALDHVEIIYTPDGQSPAAAIAKGVQNKTFEGLKNGKEYAFTVFAVDSAGKKHPVTTADFYTPTPQAPLFSSPDLSPASTPRRGTLGPLIWKPTGDSTFGESTIYALAYGQASNGAGRWVAGGTDGKMAYSNDNGLRWIAVSDTTFGSFTIAVITYANGRWVAGGGSGKMVWSTNAITWNAIKDTKYTADHNINALAFANGRWMTGGTGGVITWSSDNGLTWNKVANSTFGNAAINTIAYYGGRWIAGGTEGKIAYSDNNGETWTTVSNSTFGTNAVNVVIYDRGRWMAGGYGNRIAWSTDGTTWRPLTRPFYILGMGYNGLRWVAGGQSGRMAWSGDSGENWMVDEDVADLFGENWIQSVSFGLSSPVGGRWLSGGQNGKLIYADEEM
jgi:hypothetical protein